MKINIYSVVLTLLLICFFATPRCVSAADFNFFNFSGEDDYQVLSELDNKRIFKDFSDRLFDKWSILSADGFSNPMEVTTISLIRYVTMINIWNYFFKELPLDISLNIARQSLEVGKIIVTEDASGMVGKIEKETTKAAVDYLKDYFNKNQLKVSFGAMEMKYKVGNEEINNPLQYIIIYKKINDKRARVVVRIYSPGEIIPPASRGSIGASKGFINTLNYGQNISPFVVEINGEMDIGMYGSLYWNEDKTVIKTVFSESVPDFGLKPQTWQEKYIINPIKDTLESFSGIITFITGNKNEVVDYVFKDSVNDEAVEKEIGEMEKGTVLEEQYILEKQEMTANQELTDNSREEVPTVNEKKENNKVEEKAKEEVVQKQNEKKEEKIEKSEKIEGTNITSCAKVNQSIVSYEVIINEVAWMGTGTSANDEWIELKNVSTSDINLKGWRLQDKNDDINIVFEDITIPRDGFLLLERTNDNTLSFLAADLIYKGALSNSAEELYLFDSICQMRDFVSGSSDWPAGSSTERKTMERDDSFNSWHTYSGGVNNGIWGTPKENNSGSAQEPSASLANSNKTVSIVGSGGATAPEPAKTYCSQSQLPSPAMNKVIINEVAWMGTGTSANDEWIELKNVSDAPVSLSGWQLLSADNKIKVILGSVEIPSQGFYLFERTNDDTVPNVAMDEKYTGAMSNSDESLRLFDSSCQLMDEVLASPDWPAGDNDLKKSMERDDDVSGWHTYSSSSAETTSGLWATPKAQNSPKLEDQQDDSVPDQENNEHLLITEINLGIDGGPEYVEIYNQSENQIEACHDSDNCYYLSYYSHLSPWYDPSHNWSFPTGTILNPNTYYVIDIYRNGDCLDGICGDWKTKKSDGTDYQEPQISNSSGSFALYYKNPKYVQVEGSIEPNDEEKNATAISLKVDAVSWRDDDKIETIVKEGSPFLISDSGKDMGRKWSNGNYSDTDDNLNNFQLENPSFKNHSPKSPEAIDDLTLASSEKNSVVLSWSVPNDEDTLPADIDYEVYYSRDIEIDADNLNDIDDFASIAITSPSETTRQATITDVFYNSGYHFRIKAKDKENNLSGLSNDVSLSIPKAVHQKKAPLVDFKRSNHSQYKGPVGTSPVLTTLIEGDQQFPNFNNFTSIPVVDENGTIYFAGRNAGLYSFYAFNQNQQKWKFDCGELCGYYPAIGDSGAIYFLSGKSAYALSPSGKNIWKKDYNRVWSQSVVANSQEEVCFLANKEENSVYLICLDKEGNQIEEHQLLTGHNPSIYSEIVLDDSGNLYFSVEDSLFKHGGGELIKKQIVPEYATGVEGGSASLISSVYVSFDGNILFNVNNGIYTQPNLYYPKLYKIDSNLSQIIWSQEKSYGVLGFNEEELYYSTVDVRNYIVAIDVSTGVKKWQRFVAGGVANIVSDSSNRIYFTRSALFGANLIYGYDSNNMPEDLESYIFYLHNENSYYNPFFSLINGAAIISDMQGVCNLNI